MRHLTFTLLISLFLATAFTAQAQEDKKPEQKPETPAATTDTERPKNEVDKMIAKVQAKGGAVIGCEAPCGERANGNGLLNGEATSLPKPAYPPIARAAYAQGTVVVQVLIDYDGKVIAAAAISGHPLLQATSVQAARGAIFEPTKLDGKPVMVAGVIQYNFVAQ